MKRAKTLSGGTWLMLLGACGGGSDGPSGVDGEDGRTTITLTAYATARFDAEQLGEVDQALVQDGDGAWVAMTESGGTYTARVRGPAYGVATLCVEDGPNGSRFISVQQRTLVESTTLNALGCRECRECSLIQVSGRATGVTDKGGVSGTFTASSREIASHRLDEAYDFSLPPGPTELVSITIPYATDTPKLVARTPVLDLRSDATLNVDFASARVLPTIPVAAPTVTGFGVATTRLIATTGDLLIHRVVSFTSPLEFAQLPPDLARPGDSYRVGLRWTDPVGDGTNRNWSTTIAGTQGPFTPTLAPPWNVAAAAITQAPNLRTIHPIVAEGAVAEAPATIGVTAFGVAEDEQAALSWAVELSPDWVTQTGSTSYTLPDLSSAPGWSNLYTFGSYGGVTWSTNRVEPGSTPALTRSAGKSGRTGEYCGDGTVNGPEVCDTAGDSATCDGDCTPVVCGDEFVNLAVEQCDPPQSLYCTAMCQLENP
ncbi:MAG: hypothetical protein KBG28_24810 [Kofleriaceae bacterium]|nr:hypothetical protein [Kofleriaceae bacterium]